MYFLKTLRVRNFSSRVNTSFVQIFVTSSRRYAVFSKPANHMAHSKESHSAHVVVADRVGTAGRSSRFRSSVVSEPSGVFSRR